MADPGCPFIRSFIPQLIFIGHLLYARHYARHWEQTSKEIRPIRKGAIREATLKQRCEIGKGVRISQ